MARAQNYLPPQLTLEVAECWQIEMFYILANGYHNENEED